MRLIRLILVMGVTLVLMFVATRNAHATQDVVASSVFGVDEVEPVQPSCQPAGQMALR